MIGLNFTKVAQVAKAWRVGVAPSHDHPHGGDAAETLRDGARDHTAAGPGYARAETQAGDDHVRVEAGGTAAPGNAAKVAGPATATRHQTRHQTVHLLASVLMGYPDERLYDARPVLAEAVAGLPRGEAAAGLAAFLRHLDRTPLADLAAHYVAVFDLKRRCNPYLTYATYGDTRKRGMALLRFKHAFRAAGYEIADGELPDHLGVVCELSGRGAVEEAGRLLREHRAGIELLHTALVAERSPYANVVAAVLATLPEPTLRERAAALRLAAEGPPGEEVGLEPYALQGEHR